MEEILSLNDCLLTFLYPLSLLPHLLHMKSPSIFLLLPVFLFVLMLPACTDGDRLSVAEVSTNAVSYITSKSAVCGGKITSSPGSTISEKGICWSLNPNPTKENDFVAMGSGMSNFSGTISGLLFKTVYYVRAIS